MKRSIFFIALLFLSFIAPMVSTTELEPNHVIEGNKIYVDTAGYYLSATPHTLGSSGYVTFELMSKDVDGKIDVVFGFEKDNVYVSNPQIWLNVSHTLYNMVPYVWFNETLGENVTDYERVYYESWFYDWENLDEKIKTEKVKWKQKNEWSYVTQRIEKDVVYQYRFWVDVPFSGFNVFAGEFYFGFKDHSGSVKQAIERGTLFVLDPWYDTQWGLRKALTFDNTYSTENLTDFPVLVHLNDTYIDWDYVQNAGEDIRFTDSDGNTLLNHEIESWNDTEDAYIWVNVPQIDLGSATDLIYMYYNNSLALDGQNVDQTWNDEFKMIQHLQEATNTTTIDSTQYNNDGIPLPYATPPNSTIYGRIDNAINFDGTNDFLNIASWDSELNITASWTVEAWVYFLGQGVDQYITILSKTESQVNDRTTNYEIRIRASNDRFYPMYGNGTDAYYNEYISLSTNQWFHVVGIWNGTHIYHIIDGVFGTTTATTETPYTSSNQHVFIGDSGRSNNYYFNGTIDEVRISNVSRSASWINATYLTQTDSYITFGSEESGLANLTLTVSNMDNTNYLYAETREYLFVCSVQDSVQVTNVKLGFTDGITWINATYTIATSTAVLDSGDTVAELGTSSHTSSGYNETVTFPIYIEINVDKEVDIELYMYSSDAYGNTGWETMQTDYANIERQRWSTMGAVVVSALVLLLIGVPIFGVLLRKR